MAGGFGRGIKYCTILCIAIWMVAQRLVCIADGNRPTYPDPEKNLPCADNGRVSPDQQYDQAGNADRDMLPSIN